MTQPKQQTPTGASATSRIQSNQPNQGMPAQGLGPKNPMTPKAAARIQSAEAKQGINPKDGYAAKAQSDAAKNVRMGFVPKK